MDDKEKWVNYYVYKYLHFGNRTSNRAENTHASLKHAFCTSSGKLKTATMKITRWYEELVDNRKRRLTTGCLGESTTVVFDKVNSSRLNYIRHKMCLFAVDRINLELAKSIIPEKLTKECECLINYKYLLPCYHQLVQYNKILISSIPRRWRIYYFEGEDHSIIHNALSVPKNITKITTTTPQLAYKLERVTQILTNAQSEQQQIHSEEYIDKIIELDSKKKFEDLNCTKIVKAIKGRQKKQQQKTVAMEVCQDQERWPEVKDRMLEEFLTYQHTHYRGRIENGHMSAPTNPLIINLQDKHSPLPQQHWFDPPCNPEVVPSVVSFDLNDSPKAKTITIFVKESAWKEVAEISQNNKIK
ncbi:hypothetical protein PHYBLDRAFT_173778 [Phycomyces blakesleeanus NRRL 1555(-)]|uniref:SWIM-type domain-containing protein n=1 Tax=Phycomyces blakesleeanus (strain ATCC 8743b / DSM 1359 / FGSC 10004 / NBRC 33097 / NRRL 1555) TaxID=763407 RepID=A0A167KDY7_PHYB8|nr:hypothetical protein PHYBLDRAFT_173778 [Phycomyces blakesleeanus NRRL 1555(-)]OAD67867.1 hypothetical protein PHYBLDRAFT_173778 [Phycomyces blakesleeanus NRRL 1555(-)]|eukprot:XP_018285907.1 hypothetical protein PHYBLDRAFT_173778 [Phycomyces blakesleeanus NRRL 1555(-)]